MSLVRQETPLCLGLYEPPLSNPWYGNTEVWGSSEHGQLGLGSLPAEAQRDGNVGVGRLGNLGQLSFTRNPLHSSAGLYKPLATPALSAHGGSCR